MLFLCCEDSVESNGDRPEGPDNTPPEVQIVYPMDGDTLSAGIIIAAEAMDNDSVMKVSFYSGDSLLGTDSNRPYQHEWDVPEFVRDELHTLYAIATDISSNIGYSDTITVYIRPPSYAIYVGEGDPNDDSDGIWQPSVVSWESLLDTIGYTWQEITYEGINSRILGSGFDGLIMPGGWSGTWKQQIKNQGYGSMRDFVQNGGVYVGVSAGAFYASDLIIWEGVTYDNPLDIFIGIAEGPIPEIAPWPKYVMTEILIDGEHGISGDLDSTMTVLYYGEPFFYTLEGGNMEVVARYAYNSEPAIITFEYGLGRGLLLGPHLEIEEDTDRDGTEWGNWLYDEGSDWPLLMNAFKWLHRKE